MAKTKEAQIRFANDAFFGKGDLSVVEEIFAADYIAHAGGKDFKGHEFIKGFLGMLRSAIADIRVVEIAVLFQTDDMIAWRRTLSGVHQAKMMGIPPTEQKVEWEDMLVSRFDGGKIAEEWTVSALAGELLLKLPKA